MDHQKSVERFAPRRRGGERRRSSATPDAQAAVTITVIGGLSAAVARSSGAWPNWAPERQSPCAEAPQGTRSYRVCAPLGTWAS